MADLLSCGYRTKCESVAIAGADDLVIRSLLDRQQFFDPSGEADRLGISSAAWPLFGLVWPSGVALAARLAARPVRAGERILEVGCGLGLASLAAHRAGADITASDCHPLAERFLRANLALNSLPPMKYRHGHWTAIEPAGGWHRASRPGLVQGPFDLIVGSDVLYERDEAAVFAGFLGRHARAGTEVWIVDPDRGNRAAFVRQMRAGGFDAFEERLDRPASAAQPAYKGRLLVFRCRAG